MSKKLIKITEESNGVLVIKPPSCLQYVERDHIEDVGKEMLEAIEHRDDPRVVIDFRELDGVSSEIFPVLTAVKKKIEEKNGKLALVIGTPITGPGLTEFDPDEQCDRLYNFFQICNMEKEFSLERFMGEAVLHTGYLSRNPGARGDLEGRRSRKNPEGMSRF